jgi:uncharacterized protein
MAAGYELGKNHLGQFAFVLEAGNSETILRSEQCESKAAAMNGIASVKANGPSETVKDNT